MPIFDGQGQSASTEAKERGLGAAFAVNIRIFKSKFAAHARARYFHFDLNAGSGTNEDVGCDGSPIAFLNATKRVGETRYFAGFVDINKDYVKALMARAELATDDRCFVHHGDNAEYADAIPEIVRSCGERPEFAIGSILCDPNGTQIPIDKLAALSTVCPRIDVFINWGSSSFKRQQGRKGTLVDAIAAINKKHWLIRRQTGQQQWTLLIGRNVEVNDHRAEGFYHLDSPQGQAILDRCNYTIEELKEQGQRGQGVFPF